jgi:hypothetical protein
MIADVELVEAPGVEGLREQEISRTLTHLREQIGERVLTRFRQNPRLLVQAVTHVADALGAGERADMKAVCVLLGEVLVRVVAERKGEKAAG